MNKLKIFSIALMATATYSQAQDLEQAKKAIDAEQCVVIHVHVLQLFNMREEACQFALLFLPAWLLSTMRTQCVLHSVVRYQCQVIGQQILFIVSKQ